ncbi:MAG: DMT family transporter [Ectothiorhodospiraceae bacterium]|nr:DMT family transporter [Chromatiales bacterium]MCP5156411.1 DMT family transporter [Ectothiorhodospiraceae bacterium]
MPRLPRSGIALGATLVMLAAACTAVNAVVVRVVTQTGVDPLEVAFFRNLFGLLLVMPWLAREGARALVGARLPLHVARAVANLASMVTFFYALAHMQVADVVALNFTAPLFASVGAVLFFGERMRARRTTATVVGFAGALLILRPSFETVGAIAVLPLIAAASWAAMTLLGKRLAERESASAIVAFNLVLMVPVSALPAIAVWTTPSPTALALMLLHGVLGTVNQFLMVRALLLADAGALMPFDYVRLPFVALLGFVLFAEVPDAWTWAGGAVVFAAGAYIAHRERRAG